MAELLPPLKAQFFDANGDPLVGGKIFTYEAGTSTPKATYVDEAESSANTNPVILNSRGEASIFMAFGAYKFIVKDSADVEIYSIDNITSVDASVDSVSASMPFRDVVYLTSASSPVTIAATDVGKVYNCDCSGGAILINLPSIALVNAASKMIAFVKTDSSANKVTLDANGTDTVGGDATFLLETDGAGATIIADNGATPDDWTVLSSAAGGGGGGSGVVLDWFEGANSPVLNTLNNMQVYSFGAAEAQELYSEMTVPSNYVVGTPLVYKAKFYSASTSGTMLMRTQATLIRKELDDVASTANQHTSTNLAITASSSNDEEIQQISCDLSSPTGTINSVAISAGDTILIRLYRDTDTSTGVIGFLKKQGEVITT